MTAVRKRVVLALLPFIATVGLWLAKVSTAAALETGSSPSSIDATSTDQRPVRADLYWNIWIEKANGSGRATMNLEDSTDYVMNVDLSRIRFPQPTQVLSHHVDPDLVKVLIQARENNARIRTPLAISIVAADSLTVHSMDPQIMMISRERISFLSDPVSVGAVTDTFLKESPYLIGRVSFKIKTTNISGRRTGQEIKVLLSGQPVVSVRFSLCGPPDPPFCGGRRAAFPNAGDNDRSDSGKQSPQTYWNIWLERTESISRTYAKAPHVQAGTTYLLAIDLAALAYEGANEVISASLQQEMEEWLKPNFTPPPLSILLLLDPKFFTVTRTEVVHEGRLEASRLAQMTIDAKKMRLLRQKGWPQSRSHDTAFAVRSASVETGASPPDWLFGESTFRIVANPHASGATTIGLSIWFKDRPIDEITYSTCIVPKDSLEHCTPTIETKTLKDVNSLQVLASDGATPDAAIHFVEMGQKVKGIFHVRGAVNFEDWTVSANIGEFRNKLFNIYLKAIGEATSTAALESLGIQLFDFLFPENDADKKDNLARSAFVRFAEPSLKGKEFSDNPNSLFVRMIQQGNVPPLVVPLGLIAIEYTDGTAVSPKVKFLGSHFLIEAPLEYKDYDKPKQCISRWVSVLPPEDAGDTLKAARKEVGTKLLSWSNLGESFVSMNSFRKWNAEINVGPDSLQAAALVILSHHSTDKLFFYESGSGQDTALTPTGVKRIFLEPSVAILNGCGTAGPEGSAMLQKFNQNGFMTIIATSTEVNGYMAGAFLRLLAEEVDTSPEDSIPVSRAFFRALGKLSKVRPPINGVTPYGPRVLKYTLLGNGDLTLCAKNHKGGLN